MANELLQSAIEHIQSNKIAAALDDLRDCNRHAMSGVHMSPTFTGVLKCCQLRMISSVMQELAYVVDDVLFFKELIGMG